MTESLRDANDIKVPLGHWRWTADDPIPPVSQILKAPFWVSPEYEACRQRLLRPAADFKMTGGGEFKTIEPVKSGGLALSQAVVDPETGLVQVCENTVQG